MSVVVGGASAEVPPDDVVDAPHRFQAWRRFVANRAALCGGLVLLALVLLSLAAPLLATHSPTAIPSGDARLSPSAQHWFGTDQLGRDVFARVLYGGRTSLLIGFCSAILAGLIGVFVGAVAGFRRGWVDAVFMRITEIFLVFPAVLLAAALAVVLGRGIGTLIAVLAFVGWPNIARVARSTVLEASQEEWVEASRAIGCSEWRILWRHVLPHAAGPIAVVVTLYVSTAILGEATLSFLSIGVVEPTASWGLMIAGGRTTLASAPHIILFPAAALGVTVISLLLIADGLRDAFGVEK